MPTWAYIVTGLFLISGLILVGYFLCAMAGEADEDMGAKERLR